MPEYLAIGMQDNFSGGWAGIPFNFTPHYWIENKLSVPIIYEHGLIKEWRSACGRAEAVTDNRIRPLVVGSFPKCKLCSRIKTIKR